MRGREKGEKREWDKTERENKKNGKKGRTLKRGNHSYPKIVISD